MQATYKVVSWNRVEKKRKITESICTLASHLTCPKCYNIMNPHGYNNKNDEYRLHLQIKYNIHVFCTLTISENSPTNNYRTARNRAEANTGYVRRVVVRRCRQFIPRRPGGLQTAATEQTKPLLC